MTMTADQFNARYPVGTPVVAYPLTRPDDNQTEFFERMETVTRTPAWTLGHGASVVSVDGYAGGIALTHIDPQDQDPVPGDRVLVTDGSLNFGDLAGRTGILREVRDDEDGYNYRVTVTDTEGLVTRNGVYETWVADVTPAHDGN